MTYLCGLSDDHVKELHTREPEYGVWKTKEHIASFEAFAARGPVAAEASAGNAISELAVVPTGQFRTSAPAAEMRHSRDSE